MSTIQIQDVSKYYGTVRALDGVSVTLEGERVYGLLGRNGAGKTTLINVITNRVTADSGAVTIDGKPVVENDQVLSRVCCMSGKVAHPGEMRVVEGFRWSREFYPGFETEYAKDLAHRFRLPLDKRLRGLSTGYNSIFNFIVTLSSGAPIVFFDDPVLGVDATHREMLYRELLAQYSEHPRMVLVSTHLIDEAASIFEEVIILNEGRLILAEPVEPLLSRAYSVSGAGEAVDRYSSGKNVIREESLGRLKTATIVQSRSADDNQMIRELGLDMSAKRLQDIFVGLTNYEEE